MISLFVQELIGALVQAVGFAFIPFIVWLIVGRKKEKFPAYVGLKKPEPEKPALPAWCITIGVTLVYGVTAYLVTKYMLTDVENATTSTFAGQGAKAIPAVLAYAFIRTGFSEELFFRGFLLKRLASKMNFTAANVIQALLFGSLHGVPIFLATKNVLALVLLTLLPACMGFVMGWLDEKKNGGSIVPSWLLHGTVNLISAALSL